MASQLTHPSLAQRLRAIREAAIAAGVEGFAPKNDGQTPSAPRRIEPCVLVAGQAGEEVVVLDGDHVHWLRAVPAGTPLEAVVPFSGPLVLAALAVAVFPSQATLALAAVALTRRRRVARWLALPCLVLAVAAWLPAGGWFLVQYGGDPLSRVEVPPAVVQTPELELARELEVEENLLSLELSPNGLLLLELSSPYTAFLPGGPKHFDNFQVELGNGRRHGFEAFDATFLGPDRLLVLEAEDEGLRLSTLGLLPSTGSEASIVLPLLDAPEVRLDEEPGTWRVDGMEIGERLAPRAVKVVIRGDFSGRPPRVERWVSGAESRAFPGTWASRRGAIELVTRYEDRAWWLMLFAGDDLGSQQIDRMRLQGDEAETGGSPRLFETTQSIDSSKLGNSPTTPSPSTLRTTAWPSPGMATRVGPRSRCCAGPRGSRASIELFFRAVFSTWTPGDRRLPLTPSDRHTYTALK